jgi:predicted porin
MNFKTTAAAVALLAAMGAQAQVSVYGKIDMSFGSYKNSGAKSATKVESNGSYIGFAASEELGAGMKASVQLESNLSADTGSTDAAFWGRAANLGVSGEFGRVVIGRKDTPLFNALVAYNPFGDGGFSPAMRLMVDNSGKVVSSAASRWSNSITYATPDYNGLNASVQIGLKESDTNGNNVGFGVHYAAGPLAGGFAYQSVKTGLAQGKDDRWSLGGSYDLGVAKIYGQLGQDKDSSGATATKATFFQVGAAAPVTAEGSAMVAIGQVKNKDTDKKETLMSAAYDHSLSKRTGVYGVLSNDKATGEKSGNTLAVGVRHRF